MNRHPNVLWWVLAGVAFAVALLYFEGWLLSR